MVAQHEKLHCYLLSVRFALSMESVRISADIWLFDDHGCFFWVARSDYSMNLSIYVICCHLFIQAAIKNEKSKKAYIADVAEFDLVMQVSDLFSLI